MKELDFLPPCYHETCDRQRRTRKNVIYCVGLVLALGGLHFGNASRLRSAEAALAGARSGDPVIFAQQAHLQALQADKHRLEEKAELISQLENDAPVSAIIAQIARFMTETMAMTSLRIESVTPKATDKPAPAGHTVTQVRLQGVAANDVEVGTFYGQLKENQLFDNVTFGFCRKGRYADRQLREFEVTFVVKRVETGR